MNEENKETDNYEAPDYEGEKMKMPENTATPSMMGEERGSKIIGAPVLIGLAIVLVLILGGMYFWFSTLSDTPEVTPTPSERPTDEENNEPESTTAEAQTDNMQATSPSDEIGAIEADLEATELDNIDAELQTIETEIEDSGE